MSYFMQYEILYLQRFTTKKRFIYSFQIDSYNIGFSITAPHYCRRFFYTKTPTYSLIRSIKLTIRFDKVFYDWSICSL